MLSIYQVNDAIEDGRFTPTLVPEEATVVRNVQLKYQLSLQTTRLVRRTGCQVYVLVQVSPPSVDLKI